MQVGGCDRTEMQAGRGCDRTEMQVGVVTGQKCS